MKNSGAETSGDLAPGVPYANDPDSKKSLCFISSEKEGLLFYAPFTPGGSLSCRGFMLGGAHQRLKGRWPMGDAVAVIYGILVFSLLILYVKGCEKV